MSTSANETESSTRKLRRSRYFPSAHVPDSSVRFVTTTTSASSSNSTTSTTPFTPTALSSSGTQGSLRTKQPVMKRQEPKKKEGVKRPVRFVTTSIPAAPSDSDLIAFYTNGAHTQTLSEALNGLQDDDGTDPTSYSSTNEQLLSMAMMSEDVTVKEEEEEPEQEEEFKNTSASPEAPGPSTAPEGVPAHMLFGNDGEDEEDVKPENIAGISAPADDFSDLFTVKEEIDDDVICEGTIPGTSADLMGICGGEQQSYVTSYETEVLFQNMPSNSSGLFRRTCMKCQKTMTYDRRTEWATLSDHALQHAPYKISFHCLMCKFATPMKARIHSHMRTNHNAIWKTGCQGNEDPVSHPCCDNGDDIVRFEDVIFECFPGVNPRNLSLPEPDEILEDFHDVTHYLITFDDTKLPVSVLASKPGSHPRHVSTHHELPRVPIVKSLRKTCNSCLQDLEGVDLAQEQLLHALYVHSDFGTECNLCHQKLKCPNKFVKHSVERHDSKAELVQRSFNALHYREQKKVENMARELFNPIPGLILPNSAEKGLLPVKFVSGAFNQVRCKRCKVYVNRNDKAKGEHALLHTEFSGMRCNKCSYQVTALDRFLFHNIREHDGTASLLHRCLSELSTDEAVKVAFMIQKLFEPKPKKPRTLRELEVFGDPNAITERHLAAITRESALLDAGEVTLGLAGNVDEPIEFDLEPVEPETPPVAKRPRILRKAKEAKKVESTPVENRRNKFKNRYFDVEDE